MNALLDWEPPALRLARLRFEISFLDVRLADERRRARRELDSPLVVRRSPCGVALRGRHGRD